MARKPKPAYAPARDAAGGPPAEGLWRDGALTVKGAAEFSGRKLTAMRALIRQKKVASKKDGKLRLVSRRSLEQYLENLPDS